MAEPFGSVRAPARCEGHGCDTSLATISPEARGDATEGVPRFGRRARTKMPISRRRRRRVWRRSNRTPFFLCHLSPTPNADSDIRGQGCLATGNEWWGLLVTVEGQFGSGDRETGGRIASAPALNRFIGAVACRAQACVTWKAGAADAAW